MWIYEEAFARNRGLVTPEEQQKLRHSRVAIAGMGGVGGIGLVTLARLGVGNFTIADPDVFEVANINRQYGATEATIGRSKAEVMAEIIRSINPSVELRTFKEAIDSHNAKTFLEDADLFVDAIEFFAIDIRRILYRMAASQNIYTVAAGPVGFSAVWLIFDPKGMSFDRYFDFTEGMDPIDKFTALALGFVPKATKRFYRNMMMSVDVKTRRAASTGLACHLAAGVMACEALKVLLGRGGVHAAPVYHHFDPYLGCYVRSRLIGGNRNPLQRLKRWWAARVLRTRGTRLKEN